MISLENSEVDIMRRDLLNQEKEGNNFVLKNEEGGEETLMNVDMLDKEGSPQLYTYQDDHQYKYAKLYNCKHRVYQDPAPNEAPEASYDEHAGCIVSRYEMGLEMEPGKEYPKNYYLIPEQDLKELP